MSSSPRLALAASSIRCSNTRSGVASKTSSAACSPSLPSSHPPRCSSFRSVPRRSLIPSCSKFVRVSVLFWSSRPHAQQPRNCARLGCFPGSTTPTHPSENAMLATTSLEHPLASPSISRVRLPLLDCVPRLMPGLAVRNRTMTLRCVCRATASPRLTHTCRQRTRHDRAADWCHRRCDCCGDRSRPGHSRLADGARTPRRVRWRPGRRLSNRKLGFSPRRRRIRIDRGEIHMGL